MNERDFPEELRPFLLTNVRPTGTEIGVGAYGSVKEVAIPGAICAAKTIHSILRDRSLIPEGDIPRAETQFLQECQLMSTLRHPNIVQFLGLFLYPGERLPALVMERMLTSLHDLLQPDYSNPPPLDAPKPFFPLSLKCSILRNVACGLVYLHEQSPPIIHRDLTARNVLLNSAMVAKIADLGVARFLPVSALATMTKGPGTLVYMPPEAMESKLQASNAEQPKQKLGYNTRIDVFSFGVVAIFTLIQTFPCDLLAPTYRENDEHKPRTELERRESYMKVIQKQLGRKHLLLQIIERCLDFPEKRPSIHEVLNQLQQVKGDVREEMMDMNKLEFLQALQTCATSQNVEEKLQSQVKQLQQELDAKKRELVELQQQTQPARPLSKEERQDKRIPKHEVREEKSLLESRRTQAASLCFIHRQLSLPGKTLPPSIPLIISSQDNWNPDTGQLERGKQAPNDKSLKLVEDAIKLLRSIKKPLAVVSICGPHLSGKSYLLSRLLGCPGAFKLGHNMQPCTRGIWMATTVLEFPDFATILLDTEGTDPALASGTVATSLLTLATLLSSFLIFNSKKVPQKDHHRDLEAIMRLSQVCTSLHAQAKKSMTADEAKKFFPDVLWLLRDVHLKMTNAEGKEIEPTEILHTQILASESGELTHLGKTLGSLFPSLECATLPEPTINKKDIHNMVELEGKLRPAFNAAVDALVERILLQVTQKRAVDGTAVVNGRALAALACSYVEAMKKPGALPDLDQSWQAFVRQELNECSQRLVQEYQAEMETLKGTLPMKEKNLMIIHQRTLSKKKDLLQEEIRRLDPLHSSAKDTKPLLDQLEQEVIQWSEDGNTFREKRPSGGVIRHFTERNHTASREQCEQLISELTKTLRIKDKVEHAVENSEPLDIQTDIDAITRDYNARAVGPAAKEVLHSGLSKLNEFQEALKLIPGKPRDVKVVRSGMNQVKLSWEPPVENAEAVEEYVVLQKTGDGQWEEVIRTKELSTSIMGSAAKYEYQVIATNPLKASLPSIGKKEQASCTIS